MRSKAAHSISVVGNSHRIVWAIHSAFLEEHALSDNSVIIFMISSLIMNSVGEAKLKRDAQPWQSFM